MSRLPEELRRPSRGRLHPTHPRYAEILAAHEAALESGEPSYLDPVTGLWVWTAGYLWERGSCCDRGCRHCPFTPR